MPSSLINDQLLGACPAKPTATLKSFNDFVMSLECDSLGLCALKESGIVNDQANLKETTHTSSVKQPEGIASNHECPKS